jgi:hypothetical protein
MAKEFIELQGGSYAVDPTGATDSAAGLQTFFNDVLTSGAVGVLGSGQFRIKSALTLGNASGSGQAPPAGTAVRSLPVSIAGCGGACEYDTQGIQTAFNAIRAATTIFADPAFPTGASMLTYLGPGVLNMRGLLLHGMGVANTCFEGVGVDKPMIEDVYAFAFTGIGFNFHQNDAWTVSPPSTSAFVDDPNGGEVVRCTARSLTSNSIAFQVGSATAAAGVDVSLWTFRECEARMGGAGGEWRVGLKLQYCDALLFDHCVFDAACHIVAPLYAPTFPTNITFRTSSVNGFVVETPSDHPVWAPDLAGAGMRFIDAYYGGGELFPDGTSGENHFPWFFSRNFSGYTDAGRAFGYFGRGYNPEYSLQGTSNLVINTTAETAFVVLQPRPAPAIGNRYLYLDAGRFNQYGAVGRFRIYGNYSTLGDPATTIRLRLRLGTTGSDVTGTILFDSGAVSIPSGRNSYTWILEGEFYTLTTTDDTNGATLVCRCGKLYIENGVMTLGNFTSAQRSNLNLALGYYLVPSVQLGSAGPATQAICEGGTFDAPFPGMMYDRA